MDFIKKKKVENILTIIFGVLTIGFVILMGANNDFFQWAFNRHHNIMSWYIRPLFLIPICCFAFKRSSLGISVTVFALATSMMWFPMPERVDPLVVEFLEMEKTYLTTNWTLAKALISTLPFVLIYFLCLAFWKRSLKSGALILVIMTLSKMLWSIVSGGESGTSIFIPALVGLVICGIVLYYMLHKKREGDCN